MKETQTIAQVVQEHLCIGCGICKAVCPAQCIVVKREGGFYLPQIDGEKCLRCGLCLAHCPGRGCDYKETYALTQASVPSNLYEGNVLDSFTAVTRDEEILRTSASGGVVTTLVRHLLESGEYDCAFLVETQTYEDAAHSVRKRAGDNLLDTAKSRYLPVAQTEAVAYLLGHKTERIIFVGVPCFVQSLVRLIAKRNLDRNQYLIIGLFCEATMNYNVVEYLAECANLPLDAVAKLHFKNKELNGWPGNVCLFDKEGKRHDLPKSVRMGAKPYFSPERCLYCVDKCNQFADVSVGDNYTKRHAERMGSSSVLVRTQRGMVAKDAELFQIWEEEPQRIFEAQKVAEKVKNLCFQRMSGATTLIRNEEFSLPADWERYRSAYEAEMHALSLGAVHDFPAIREELRKKAEEKRKRKSFWGKLKRLLGL